MPTRTDPADELYNLFSHLQSLESKNDGATYKVLAGLFETGKSTADLMAIIAIILKRLDRLKNLVASIENMDDGRRRRATGAINALAEIISPARLGMAWKQNILTIPQNGNLQTLEGLSLGVRPLVSYNIPTADERKSLIDELDEAIAELPDNGTVVTESLRTNLEALRAILKKLEFFGIEELGEKLALARLNLNSLATSDVEAGSAPEKNKWIKIAKVLFRIAEIVVVMNELPAALAADYHAASDLIQWVAQDSREHTPGLLLPPVMLNNAEPSRPKNKRDDTKGD